MKRFLTALAIILVVVIAGMTALILLVNPNDFRGYMVKKVEDKTGYQLNLEGDLRWHVWPQLSILSGKMTLTAPGAAKPLVSAENMRLDVELMPLLSHQLVVNNVVLKGGVIQLIPDTQGRAAQNAPIAPDSTQNSSYTANTPSSWSLELDKIVIADSLLVWQHSENDIINVRDINFTLTRAEARQADLTAKARISRNQRELSFSLNGVLDLSHFPQELGFDVSQLDYQLQGASIPAEGIAGKSSSAFNIAYQSSTPSIKISPLCLTLNDSQITAELFASLGQIPQYNLAINTDSLNLDQLFLSAPADMTASSENVKDTPAPVISSANGLSKQTDFTFLRDFNANLFVAAKQLVFHNITVDDLLLKANNRQGKATIETLQGNLIGGSVNVTGSVDATASVPEITLNPVMKNVALDEMLKTLNYPQSLAGQLNLRGSFNSDGKDLDSFVKGWQGNAHISIENARLYGLNIQQLIHQAASRSNQDVQGQERYERYTEVPQLVVDAQFRQGEVHVSQLHGESASLTVAGSGVLNLPTESCDMNLNIRVIQGWSGKADVIAMLQNTSIPLRIYGAWNKLNYQLNVEQLLREQVKEQAGKAIEKWIDKNKDKQKSKDVKKLLDKFL
ncbi:MAG: outer membrane assembly protein AsmA [Enterobacteriaceae bacterium]|jgi:AsmA protein|nr:outer membrane assembly protein AsmA [Enterobacteriaceae bacterium]